MSRAFLNSLNLSQNELQNAKIQNLATAPSSPVVGQIYYDTTLLAERTWDGTTWSNKATDSLLLQGNNAAYYLNRANHTGTQLASTISNFDTQVRTSTLNQMAPPTTTLDVNGQRITNMGTPTATTDATTKAYVDALFQGVENKMSAEVATTAALPTNTYANGSSGVGSTLTANANAALVVDSYTVATGDRILVKNEATSANNGLYVVTQPGSASTPYILTRDTGMDQSTEFRGALIAVENRGSTTGNTLWLCNNTSAMTVGTTAVIFTQLNAPTSYTAGNGITISANTISANVVSGGGILAGATGLSIDTTVVARRYSTAIGDGSSTSITVTHNFNTRDVTCSIVQTSSPYNQVETDVSMTTVNSLTLVFAVAPASGAYRVTVTG